MTGISSSTPLGPSQTSGKSGAGGSVRGGDKAADEMKAALTRSKATPGIASREPRDQRLDTPSGDVSIGRTDPDPSIARVTADLTPSLPQWKKVAVDQRPGGEIMKSGGLGSIKALTSSGQAFKRVTLGDT